MPDRLVAAGKDSLIMGSNVIRMARGEHRALQRLAVRLERPYRDETLRSRLATDIRAHIESQSVLTNFAATRISDWACVDPCLSLDAARLFSLASELEDSPDPVPAELVERLVNALAHHEGWEEATILDPLDQMMSVQKLRDIGDAWAAKRRQFLKRNASNRPARRTDLSHTELYELARGLDVTNRSTMNKTDLRMSISLARAAVREPSH